MGNVTVTGDGASQVEAVKSLNRLLFSDMHKELKQETTIDGTRYYLKSGGRRRYVYYKNVPLFGETLHRAYLSVYTF